MKKFNLFQIMLYLVLIVIMLGSCELKNDQIMKPKTNEKGEISLNMSLKKIQNINSYINTIHVIINGPTNTEGNLTISSDTTSATGKFTNLLPGDYAISVVIYNFSKDTLAYGSTQAEVKPGEITKVTITMSINTGELDITVNWNFIAQQKIVFQSDRDGDWDIYAIDIDGSNLIKLTYHDSSDCEPTWSPNNKKIAFTSNRDGNLEIYLIDLSDLTLQNLTNNPADDSNPAWSPSGEKLAFRTNRDGNYEIYVMNADGSNPVNLTNHPDNHDSSPDWSPDGSQIVFSSWRTGDARLFIMEADGSNPTIIPNTKSWAGHPKWSPDGDKIAYSAWGNIYIINIDGTNNFQLTTSGGPDTDEENYVGDWSPDGLKLVCMRDHIYSFSKTNNQEIYIIKSDGTGYIEITNNPANDSSPDWKN